MIMNQELPGTMGIHGPRHKATSTAVTIHWNRAPADLGQLVQIGLRRAWPQILPEYHAVPSCATLCHVHPGPCLLLPDELSKELSRKC